MKSQYILLAVVIQGVCGQLFSVEPQAENVAREGDQVTLECVTREPVSLCAWKLEDTGLGTTGILTSNPASLASKGITARDPKSFTDCSITIESVMAKHNGKYICSPFGDNGQVDSIVAEVIVAQKPAVVEITGPEAGATELAAVTDGPVSVTCEARDARPKAELRWFLGELELYEGATTDYETDPGSQLVTSRSTLTHQFARDDDGSLLRCQATHPGYADEDEREAALTVMVQYAPIRAEGPDMGTLYGFTEGDEKNLTVNFTANPRPSEIVWTVGDRQLRAGEEIEGGRLAAGDLEEVSAADHLYALRLTFRPVQAEDQDTAFQLRLANERGEENLSFRLGAGAPPPPTTTQPPAPEGNNEATDAAGGEGRPDEDGDNGGVSGGAIGGIIVAVLLLLAVIGIVAFGRSRGKWCFAAKRSDAGAEADTESAHDEKTDKPEKKGFKLSNLYPSLVTKKKEADVEMAANKDETKELTGPDGEASPKREQPEVVYAELVLDKDGIKTEVRPSPEKTEYAVIVGTKQEEPKE